MNHTGDLQHQTNAMKAEGVKAKTRLDENFKVPGWSHNKDLPAGWKKSSLSKASERQG